MSSFRYITAEEEGFKDSFLDRLLAAGFYRMQHIMFTCNEIVINHEGTTIPVFWLRTLVQQYKLSRGAAIINKKCSRFNVQIQKAYIDDEVETLYALYKNHIQFRVSDTCADYLHRADMPHPFNSFIMQVRDGDRLIAVGYFDKGNTAIAGILNIYHPDYKQYSLGKFLILKKLEYALSHDMMFYYTGYISTESTRFDYKIFPDAKAVEVLLPVKQQWMPYHLLNKDFLAAYYTRFLQESKEAL
ncbi:MAG TPA: GNAT family N-acetyltransferase [Parafilimonas sp.]|nr:GNAT family N-acetyltransferase [Parafilimonas sp.]